VSDSVPVPDVLDETTASAQRKLEAVGLKLGTISTEKNPGGVPGTVLGTSPGPGSLVPQGSAVDLVIIEAADALPVPNLVGLTRLMAEQQLTQAGLRVGAVSAEKIAPVLPWEWGRVESHPLGTVVRTSPGAGGQAAPNSGVDLVIAEEAELTVMPNVLGQELKPVLEFLLNRGHPVDVYLQGRKLDVVHDIYSIVYQSPEPGYPFGPRDHGPESFHIKLAVE
jgi:beta-lactam-binding protein with PASTA domain